MAVISVYEIEEKLRSFDPRKRLETLRALTDLFLASASQLDEDGVEVFDKVFDAALGRENVAVLTDISERMAPISNAPTRLIKRLANDPEISIAKPVLSQSTRLGEADLCEIARLRSNAHLLAISTRKNLTCPVTDILLDRGDNQVARTVASNETAKLSESGIAHLIRRAKNDETISVGLYARPDLPSDAIEAGLASAETCSEGTKARIAAAQRFVLTIRQTSELTERHIDAFAEEGKYEELVAAISFMAKLKFHVLESMMYGERLGGLALVGKSLGFSMTTMNSLWKLAVSRNEATAEQVQGARKDFLAVSREIAERVVRFWLVRQSTKSL